MKHMAHPLRMVAALAITSLTSASCFADDQSASDAIEAAEAAEQISAAAEDGIVTIDPTTGEEQLPSIADVAPEVPAIAANNQSTVSNPVVQDVPQERVTRSRQIERRDEKFVVKSILPIEGTIKYGEWYWDESRAPQTGKLVMTVDLDARVISVFRDGHEIGTAVALLGTQKHPTPLGTFPILTKEIDNVSEKYDNAPMPYTLRLTWDGIAIHGSPVANGYASHGCVGVPNEFAAKLFEIARRGDKVVITRGQMIGLGDTII